MYNPLHIHTHIHTMRGREKESECKMIFLKEVRNQGRQVQDISHSILIAVALSQANVLLYFHLEETQVLQEKRNNADRRSFHRLYLNKQFTKAHIKVHYNVKVRYPGKPKLG